MKEPEVKWSVKRVCVIQVSIRKRKPPEKDEWEDYGVIKVGSVDEFEEEQNPPKKKKGSKKYLTLMCFEENLFPHIVEGEVFSFGGKTSFGYGNTFFKITWAKDALGLEVGKGQSLGEIQDSLPSDEPKGEREQ